MVKNTAPQRAEATVQNIAELLQKTAADLLADKVVDLVIGYGRSTGGDIVPLFLQHPEEAGQLQWNRRCTYNLVRYLTDPEVAGSLRESGKVDVTNTTPRSKDAGKAEPTVANRVAIVVKGCDLKSLVVLQSEHQVQRERLTVIALPCQGVTDEAGRLPAKCESCAPEVYNPRKELCDVVIGKPVQHSAGKPPDPDSQITAYNDVEQIQTLTLAERRAMWDGYFARCLRCYACRNVCPLCYCKECVFDQHDPRWVSPAASVASNRSFHLIRAYHLAGRCVDCGECERACPVGIPLRLINHKVAQVVEESFHFRAGLDPQAKSPLVSYADGDPQEFIE